MEDFSINELTIIYEALKERSNALDETSRKGISEKIRKVAREEYKENGNVWSKVERLLIKKSEKN